jgi:hypothetical protein
MRAFDELIDEAAAVDVSGWNFDWLHGRATEQRPPWGYSRLLASRLGRVEAALDVDTGGGEIVAEAPRLPPAMVVTEGWPPNVARAHRLLSPRGVAVVHVRQGRPLPFRDARFALVSSRHPVDPDWGEIARVLAGGGTYLAQHVGPASAFELIEWFRGPLPRNGSTATRNGRPRRRGRPACGSCGCGPRGAGWSSRTSARSSTSCARACGGSPISPSSGTPRRCDGWTPTSASTARSSPIPPGP